MTSITKFWTKLAEMWCYFAHPSPRWPIHGRYECPTCLRTYPVRWEQRSDYGYDLAAEPFREFETARQY